MNLRHRSSLLLALLLLATLARPLVGCWRWDR
jgi:hypothetical protein